MPLRLNGSCRCGAIRFSLDSHTPVPYQLCYCSICRKTAGGGGFAINIMGVAETLEIEGEGRAAMSVYRAAMLQPDGSHAASTGQRHFCNHCATALWLFDETWPDLIHPFAAVIDTPLPPAATRVHLMLADKPAWVKADIGPDDACFQAYPEESIEDWHKARGLWVD